MSATADAAPADGLDVGDTVLVESAKATFFEGTIVSRKRDTVRVQPKPAGDAAERPVSDVYRIGGPAPKLDAGAYAICRAAPLKWRACRIDANEAEVVVAYDADANELRVPQGDVLAPTAVTELNVRQALERGAKRRAFREGAERAGGPKAPVGYRPRPGELVIARRDGVWVGARVKELRKKLVKIVWEGDKQPVELAREELLPQPPVAYAPVAGAYVLVRPPAGVRAWTVGRIESIAAGAIAVSDELGEKRSVTLRDVLPLER